MLIFIMAAYTILCVKHITIYAAFMFFMPTGVFIERIML